MRIILLSVFIFSFFAAMAQNDLQQLSFQHISEKEGLSNSIVNSIAKDKNGFMWIATFDGLNRFDGTHFINYRNNRNNTESISQNTVHGICVDSSNDIWCATQTGISCFHQQTQVFENFMPDKKTQHAFFDILCDTVGAVWCSGEDGLYEYDKKNHSFTHYSNRGKPGYTLTSNNIYKRGTILSPDKKYIWLTTLSGINCIDINSKKIFNYKNNPRKLLVLDSFAYYPLAFDKNENLVYGREAERSNLNVYNFSSNTITNLDILYSSRMGYTAPADRIFIDKENNYWISTWGYTLFKYDAAQKQVHEFSHDDASEFSVSANFFWDAYQDNEGTLWLGTVDGLSFTNEDHTFYKILQPFQNFISSSSSYIIRRFAEDTANALWFTCTGQNSIYKYDAVKNITDNFEWAKAGIRENTFTDITAIATLGHYLLFGTDKGVYVFNTITKHFETAFQNEFNLFIKDESILSLKALADSSVYILTEKGNIFCATLSSAHVKNIKHTSTAISFTKQAQYLNDLVMANGKWLLCFSPLAFAEYDPLSNICRSLPLQLPESLKSANAETAGLREDADGDIWVCPKGIGLIKYSPVSGKTTLWQQNDGLINNFVFANAVDQSGRIWIAGYNKFSVYDPAQNRFENFTLSLSRNNYSYSNKFITLHNGNLLCNIDKYFVECIPPKLKTQQTDAHVLINAFKVFDSSRQINSRDNSIILNYKENYFTIEFGLLTGLEKNRYQLQYKLEGLNDKWMNADALNAAAYTNVPEKEFLFKVRAVATDGSWEGKETTLKIIVTPPFYRTTWFRILAALLFASAVVFIVRLRFNAVRKEEARKTEINKMVNEWRMKALRSQMNPHFIFNCMNSIDLYILKNDAENASRYLNKFARLVRLILNHSDEMTIPLSKEIEMLKYYIELEALRFDTPFEHTIIINKNINTEETEIPSMLIQPYVENAIVHGLRHKKGKGYLKIEILRRGTILHCIIEDDGIGRKASAVINAQRSATHTSKGLKLTEERLRIMDTEQSGKAVVTVTDLIADDGTAAGTRTEIEIPCDEDA